MAESKQRDANENPWYVLATIYGEQKGERVDYDLANRNVWVWNAWATQAMSDEEIGVLREGAASGLDGAGEWEGMKADIVTAFRERLGAKAELPTAGSAIDFSNTLFSCPVAMSNSVFTQHADFHSATFTQAARFTFATFTQAAWFTSARFNKDANFRAASFKEIADFRAASFTRYVSFRTTSFTHDTRFSDANFAGRADFNSAILSGLAYFSRTRFEGASDFTDCRFEKPTNFRNARFEASYPVLGGADLHLTTSFTARDTEASRRLWPDRTEGSQKELEAAKDSCSIIRHAVAQQGRPEDEHFFFRKEMGFAAQIGGVLQRLPYQLFGWVSGFGYSIARPVACLGVVWLLSAFFSLIVFIGFEGRFPVGQNLAAAGEAAALSLSNMLAFLGFRGLYFDAGYFAGLPVVLKVLGGAQTFTSFVLLFFLGLGLRTRFWLR